jgi:regulator of sirC expression with transglutaminase-like and TPR domain
LGQTRSALKDFNAALKIRPDDPDLFYNRGMVYEAMGEKSNALADIQKAARAGHAKAREYLEASR